jgi:hypothetical protein
MWHCSNCQKSTEDSFGRCWSCGASPDGTLDPDFVHADDYQPGAADEPYSRRFSLASLFTVTAVIAVLAAIGRVSGVLTTMLTTMLISVAVIPFVIKFLERLLTGPRRQ